MNANGTEGMMTLPGPQDLTSILCGTDLFKVTLFQLGFLEGAEGPALLESTSVELEFKVEDDELEDPALSLSSRSGSRVAFDEWTRTRGSGITLFPRVASFTEDAVLRFGLREVEVV